jgi:hypothetical protein
MDDAFRIVAVHGLNGHREATWTYEDGQKTMWLRDLLPLHFPNVRISTYGYQVDKDGFSTAWIKERSVALLKALKDRTRSPERGRAFDSGGFHQEANKVPFQQRKSFVFIGHDLGGVIIKQVELIPLLALAPY